MWRVRAKKWQGLFSLEPNVIDSSLYTAGTDRWSD